MFERSDCGHRTCAELMSYRTALHVDDRVVSIFALRGCRQAVENRGYSADAGPTAVGYRVKKIK